MPANERDSRGNCLSRRFSGFVWLFEGVLEFRFSRANSLIMKSCSVWTSLGANISLSAVDILMFGSEKIHFDKMSRVKILVNG